MTEILISGIDYTDLQRALEVGSDHGGNPIEPFVDEKGGWPLRCCLSDSAPGDEIAIIAWSPFPWAGAYAETGPVVVHATPCGGPPGQALPPHMDGLSMTLRPYGHDRRIAYHHVRHVPPGGSLTAHVRQLLAFEDVDFVHGRNTTGGCFSFTGTIVPET